MKNTTATISCFARAYHRLVNAHPVFDDTAARALLGEQFDAIAQNISAGVRYFLPDFTGTPEAGLRLVVDEQLAPSVLARSAFCEQKLAASDCGQYVIFASGYDTFAIRNADAPLPVFELDLPKLLSDKQRRIDRAGLKTCAVYIPCDLSGDEWEEKLLTGGFRPKAKSFGSLLGISYYLKESELAALLCSVAKLMLPGSLLCMDYPSAEESRSATVNRELAFEAGEPMQASYRPERMQKLLSDCGFAVLEHLSPEQMTRQFFAEHNSAAPELPMRAPDGVRYILAEKSERHTN